MVKNTYMIRKLRKKSNDESNFFSNAKRN